MLILNAVLLFSTTLQIAHPLAINISSNNNFSVAKITSKNKTFTFRVPESSVDRAEIILECSDSFILSLHNNMDHLYRFYKDGNIVFSLHGQSIVNSVSSKSVFLLPIEDGKQAISEVHSYSYGELCQKYQGDSFNAVRAAYSLGSRSSLVGGQVMFSLRQSVISQHAEKNGVFLAVILPEPLVNSPAPQEVEVLACNVLICKTFKVTELRGSLFEAKDFKFLDDKTFSFYVIDYEKINVSKKQFIFEFDASMMTVQLR